MVSRKTVEDFFSSEKLAVVGVSRNGKKFGRSAFKELKAKGYKVFPVNPNADKIDGETCYPNLNSLPEKADGAVIVVQPSEAEKVVREAAEAGIKKVWFQQGSLSNEAISFCENNGINAIYGECVLMFAEPVAGFHKFHRTVKKILRKLPK